MIYKWRMDNTEGYTQAELDAINAEWQARWDANDWDEDSAECEQQYKEFCDEVSTMEFELRVFHRGERG